MVNREVVRLQRGEVGTGLFFGGRDVNMIGCGDEIHDAKISRLSAARPRFRTLHRGRRFGGAVAAAGAKSDQPSGVADAGQTDERDEGDRD